ncbi:VOC family protein [Paenibacillus thalictri]|uniref:Bleomycin resistance protein n=1 Tax=Paenibacillus thalictri TaxID=2527873 RepID=A0A4Q9DGQ4_9BACL|nr:VOC family protein [Paenibacillus thalictri]TBL69717.1 bleomycin resistance protein [Paenibacillus thalictri]
MEHIENCNLVKIGIVVDDIEQAAKRYAELFGIEPPTVRVPDPNREPQHTEAGYTWYRGKFVPGRVKLSNLRMGAVTVELLEACDEPGPWNEFKQRYGQGVHFITFTVPGFERHIDLMERMGYPLAHKGEYGKGRYSYFDTLAQLGVTLGLQELGEPLDTPVMPAEMEPLPDGLVMPKEVKPI